MSNQENIKKLTELREEALTAIKAYNKLAELEGYETRIGCIDATINVDDIKYEMAVESLGDDETEPSDELVQSMVVDIKSLLSDYNESPIWYNTQFPGTKESWAPSGINC